MTKSQMIAAIAERSGLNKDQARQALEVFLDQVTDALKDGREVRLVGFGSFVPIKRAAGAARNPRTGEVVARPASRTCRFRVGDALKTTLNT
jgi:DNA-binding protein HU-beta